MGRIRMTGFGLALIGAVTVTAGSLSIPFDPAIAPGPYAPNEASLAANYSCPDWFRDAKFGIYMHWGLNSVSGLNGHYARFMYHQHDPCDPKTGWASWGADVYQYHVTHYGHPSRFGYKDFIPLWHAEKFDALALGTLFKEVGARYIGVMAVHCDNFDCYDSTYQPWNSVRMGPRIDIVGAWKRACETLDLPLAITSHLSNGYHEHVFYQGEADTTGPLAGVPYDTVDPRYAGLYGTRTADRRRRLEPEFGLSWYRRTKELIDRYDPDLFYLDGGLPHGDLGLHLAAHFYNQRLRRHGRRDGVFTIKRERPRGFTLDVESAGVQDLRAAPWQVDTSLNEGWFYLGVEQSGGDGANDAGMGAAGVSAPDEDPVRMTAGQVVDNLVDIVSKNGNMMLNVGLRPDGSLPASYRRELRAIGAWLRRNGEAIYGTRPFVRYGEGPSRIDTQGGYNDNTYRFTARDIRFTTRGPVLYAIFLDWPGDGAEATITSLTPERLAGIRSVRLLAADQALTWRRDAGGLHLRFPATPVGRFAYVVAIE